MRSTADKDETIDEAGRIADAIVVVHESNDPFWDESARSMVKGLILHVLTAPEYEGRRNLITVRNLIMRGDWEAVEALQAAGETDIPPAHGLLWTGLVEQSGLRRAGRRHRRQLHQHAAEFAEAV